MKEKFKEIIGKMKALWNRIPWEKIAWLKAYNPFRFI